MLSSAFATKPLREQVREVEQLQEADEAREDVAAKCERIARLIRASTTSDITRLDEVYRDLITISAKVRTLLT